MSAENRKTRDKVLTLLRRKAPGDVVTHGEIARASGLEPGSPLYNRLVLKARERLRDEGGAWSRPLYGEGYQLYTPGEQLTTEWALRHKKAGNQLKRGYKAVVTLDDAALTPNMRRMKDARIASHDEEIRRIREQQKIAEMASRPNPRNIIHPNPAADEERIRRGEYEVD
jgi:hypothetical protein